MNTEELAANATITAANIQADIAMQAAYLNSAAIIIGIFISWMTALHVQKVARLAETRRNVYLELIENFSEMHTAFYTFINQDAPLVHLIEKANKFGITADKASFVAKTTTKKDIYIFLATFQEKITSVLPYIEDHIAAKENFDILISLHKSTTEAFKSKIKYIEELYLSNSSDTSISRINEILEKNLEESERQMESINQSLNDLNLTQSIAKSKITEFLNSINDLAIPISHKLRSELGAKTDIELDYSIHKENKFKV